MNDSERELWVLNTEALYLAMLAWRRRNRGGMRGFIRAHRDEIDRIARKSMG